MFAVALAAASALVWGTADFSGGKAAQGAPAVTVSVISKLISLPVLALFLVLLPAAPRAGSLAWGAMAGVAGMVALIVFYRALSLGAMAVVAPISAVTSALVPMTVGLVIEDSPGALALTGVGCAIVAIGLVSMAPGGAAPGGAASGGAASGGAASGGGVPVSTPRLVSLALTAGAGFGLFFVFLDRAGAAVGGDDGLWPVAASQLSALAVGGALSLWTRTSPRLRSRALRWTVAAGILDMSANALYLLAVQAGMLTIVAPVASLYPVSTVLLAMLIDRERVRPIQLAGLGLAATALVLVAS